MKEKINYYHINCPLCGDITNDCENCHYSLDYHYVNGQCVRRDGKNQPMFVSKNKNSYLSVHI